MPKVRLDTSKVLDSLERAKGAMAVVESSEDPREVAEAADALRHAGQELAIEAIDVLADAFVLARL